MGEILYKGPNENGLYPIPTSLSTKKSPQPQFTSYPSYGNLSQENMAAMASTPSHPNNKVLKSALPSLFSSFQSDPAITLYSLPERQDASFTISCF